MAEQVPVLEAFMLDMADSEDVVLSFPIGEDEETIAHIEHVVRDLSSIDDKFIAHCWVCDGEFVFEEDDELTSTPTKDHWITE